MNKPNPYKLKLLTALILLSLPTISTPVLATNYVAPVFPVDPNSSSTPTGSSRYGEGRHSGGKYPRGYGSYAHTGIDVNAVLGKPLYAVDDGVVIASVQTGSGGGIGTALKPNGVDMVFVYWHQSRIHKDALGVGKKVKKGQLIGYSGGTASQYIGASNNAYKPHLHLGVGVPNRKSAQQTWLNNVPTKNNGSRNPYYSTFESKTNTPAYGGKSYFWTNPAPYLAKDMIVTTSLGNSDPLLKYLGNSIRSQYNALTGANLPLGSGAYKGQYADKIPKLKIGANGVPSSIATESAQSAVIGVLADGNADEILGQDSITPEELAYYAPPRTIFTGSNNSVPIDIGDGDITSKELIEKIGSSRFGNVDWNEQLIDISMRGMLIEYLNMINAKNFIKKEHIKQKERIESLYSAWSAQVAKMNVGGQLQEDLEKTVSPNVIPEISSLPVEELFDRIEMGYPISPNDLTSAISVGGSQYKRCDNSYKDNYSRLPDAYKRELLALSLRLGFSPNDFLTAVAVETSFNMQKMYPKPYIKKGEKNYTYPAGGFIQLTGGGAGDIPYKTIAELYPQSKPILQKHLGENYKKYKGIAHGVYLQNLGNLNPRYEFAVYDAYFYAKNRGFNSVPPSKKTLGLLYKMIFGVYYNKNSKNASSVAGYYANKQYDVDGNGIITAEEAVSHERFRIRNCNYIDDQDVLSNRYGLTDNDLKFIPWDNNIKKNQSNSPTVGNVKGNFMVVQSLKARMQGENSVQSK